MALSASLPWTKTPLIINAPMGGFAGDELATAVSRVGGLGQIGAAADMDDLTTQLTQVERELSRTAGSELLPVGVGLLTFIVDMAAAMAVLEKFRPAVVWLFAANESDDYGRWGQAVRSASAQSKVWVQVCTVEAALTVARSCRPDVMCVQGADAGGHGFEKSAGIISLLPEVSDALAAAGFGEIPLVAAGGIVNARSAAAALALGAQGVVMGTRFLSAPETRLHPQYREAILATQDGGQNTTRSKVFDQLRGPNRWPVEYDGRGIVSESITDHANGVHIDDIRSRHAEALKADHGGFGSRGKGRAVVWAGTGVGMVKEVQPAAEIVEEVRRGIAGVLEMARSKI